MANLPALLSDNDPFGSNRQVRRELERVRRGSIVQAAKITAVGFVTQVAMTEASAVSIMQQQLARIDPLGADDYNDIARVGKSVMAIKVAETGRQFLWS